MNANNGLFGAEGWSDQEAQFGTDGNYDPHRFETGQQVTNHATIASMIEDTAAPTGLYTDDHEVTRCVWCRATPEYQHYHDHEWGFPVQDDRRLFEKVCLEGFQAGLSWLTILNKREAFRRGFADFDMDRIAGFGESETKRLLLDAGIVRHRGKIASTIKNAQRAIELRKEFGSLAAYFWRFEPASDTRSPQITRQTLSGITTSPQSIALSKDLRRRGWSFVGPTTMYAFMQAMGLVNDHIEGCAARRRALQARSDIVGFPKSSLRLQMLLPSAPWHESA